MSEVRPDDERTAAALRGLAADVTFPVAPSLAEAVTSRLVRERASRARPALPSLALWSRRRLVVALAIGLLGALGIAAAARLTIGAITVRVQPTPTVSLPPVEPDVLGDPLAAAQAEALAGFEPALPPGPAPDEAYVVQSPFGDAGLVYAWRPSAGRPAIPGTTWEQVLMAFQGDDERVVKTVERFEDVRPARVNATRAFWIPVPHQVVLETDRGTETFLAEGNVLIWEVDGVTYRLETTLGKARAVALAETFV